MAVSVPKPVEADASRLYEAYARRGRGYGAFAESWRALNFSLIHYAGRDEQERTETLEDFLAHAVSMLSSSNPFERRLFAVYFAYALFSSQPKRQGVTRLRVTQVVWHDLRLFADQLHAAGHRDALAALEKLCDANAFQFVATLQPLQPPLQRDETALVPGSAPRRPSLAPVLQEFGNVSSVDLALDSENLELLRVMSEDYYASKRAVTALNYGAAGAVDEEPAGDDAHATTDSMKRSLNLASRDMAAELSTLAAAHVAAQQERMRTIAARTSMAPPPVRATPQRPPGVLQQLALRRQIGRLSVPGTPSSASGASPSPSAGARSVSSRKGGAGGQNEGGSTPSPNAARAKASSRRSEGADGSPSRMFHVPLIGDEEEEEGDAGESRRGDRRPKGKGATSRRRGADAATKSAVAGGDGGVDAGAPTRGKKGAARKRNSPSKAKDAKKRKNAPASPAKKQKAGRMRRESKSGRRSDKRLGVYGEAARGAASTKRNGAAKGGDGDVRQRKRRREADDDHAEGENSRKRARGAAQETPVSEGTAPSAPPRKRGRPPKKQLPDSAPSGEGAGGSGVDGAGDGVTVTADARAGVPQETVRLSSRGRVLRSTTRLT